MWIYGNGGHAKVVRWIMQYGHLETGIDIVPLHVIDDADPALSWQSEYQHEFGVIAIGNNRTRQDIATRLDHHKFVRLWSEHSSLATMFAICDGTVIMPQAAVNGGAMIGRHAIVNTGATVDHDCTVASFAHIAPGAHLCGGVKIGEGTLVGAGTVVVPGIAIGPWLTIPAGSVVTKDIPDEAALALLRGRRNQGGE